MNQIEQIIIRPKEAFKNASICRTKGYDLIRKGLFPEPFSIGGRAKGFLLYEVNQIILAMASGLNDEAIKDLVKALKKNRSALIHEKINEGEHKNQKPFEINQEGI